MSSTTTRALATLTVLAGACWAVMAAVGLLTVPEAGTRVVLSSFSEYLGHGAFALALALTIPAIVVLHAHQQGADGALGRTGAAIAALGCAGQCVVISTIVISGEEPAWFGQAAPAAILTWVVGSVLLGIAIRRAGVLPRWTGAALPVVTVLAIVGSEGGTGVLIAIYLAVVGTRLLRAAGGTADGVTGRARLASQRA